MQGHDDREYSRKLRQELGHHRDRLDDYRKAEPAKEPEDHWRVDAVMAQNRLVDVMRESADRFDSLLEELEKLSQSGNQASPEPRFDKLSIISINWKRVRNEVEAFMLDNSGDHISRQSLVNEIITRVAWASVCDSGLYPPQPDWQTVHVINEGLKKDLKPGVVNEGVDFSENASGHDPMDFVPPPPDIHWLRVFQSSMKYQVKAIQENTEFLRKLHDLKTSGFQEQAVDISASAPRALAFDKTKAFRQTQIKPRVKYWYDPVSHAILEKSGKMVCPARMLDSQTMTTQSEILFQLPKIRDWIRGEASCPSREIQLKIQGTYHYDYESKTFVSSRGYPIATREDMVANSTRYLDMIEFWDKANTEPGVGNEEEPLDPGDFVEKISDDAKGLRDEAAKFAINYKPGTYPDGTKLPLYDKKNVPCYLDEPIATVDGKKWVGRKQVYKLNPEGILVHMGIEEIYEQESEQEQFARECRETPCDCTVILQHDEAAYSGSSCSFPRKVKIVIGVNGMPHFSPDFAEKEGMIVNEYDVFQGWKPGREPSGRYIIIWRGDTIFDWKKPPVAVAEKPDRVNPGLDFVTEPLECLLKPDPSCPATKTLKPYQDGETITFGSGPIHPENPMKGRDASGYNAAVAEFQADKYGCSIKETGEWLYHHDRAQFDKNAANNT